MKKKLELGEIGTEFGNLMRRINFSSKESLFDLDVLFLDINYIAFAYTNNQGYCKSETVPVGFNFFTDFLRRQRDIKDFIDQGKYLVVFSPIPQLFHNGNTNQESILDLFPFHIRTKHSEGKKIDIYSNTKFSNFLGRYQNNFHYESVFEEYWGTPIASVQGNDMVIASFYENVLFIPKFTFQERDKLRDFINELIEIFTGDGGVQYEIPKWSENYLLPGEKEITSKLSDLIVTQEELLEKIKKEAELLEKINEYKVLFTGTGDSLEVIVQNLFSELGFQILEREPNRDDLIMRYNENIFVVEIKGVKGSAGENQAAQLEKWVSEYNSNNENHAKGILVVNAFKDMEIKNRDATTFPHQMLKYSEKRDHCLISGLQLLGLYFKCKQTPAEKDNLIQSLHETVGVYKGFEDWNEFIEYKTDDASAPATKTAAAEEIK